MLKGTRLDQVADAKVDGIDFKPTALNRVEDADQLIVNAAASTSALEPGAAYTAHVNLKDGRTLDAPVIVEPPRPQIALLSKGVQQDGSTPLQPVQLGSPNDLPVDGRLVFFLKSNVPEAFPRDEKVEMAAADTSFHTLLTLSDGSLILEDAGTAVGSIEPLARFGSSAFGPVRVRAIAADGEAGDWLPLGTLVRLPGFQELRCPRAVSKPCVIEATNLFLVTSFSATSGFENPMEVAPEFTGTELIVPHPINGVLYLKLRDDPATVQTLALPITPIAPSAAASTHVREPSSTDPAETPAELPVAPKSEPPAGKPAAGSTEIPAPGTQTAPPAAAQTAATPKSN